LGTRELSSRVVRKTYEQEVELDLKAAIIFMTDMDCFKEDFASGLDTRK